MDQTGLPAATGVLSTCIAFRHQHLSGKTTEEIEAYLARMPDAAKRERQTENIFKGVDSKFFPAGCAGLTNCLPTWRPS